MRDPLCRFAASPPEGAKIPVAKKIFSPFGGSARRARRVLSK